jgi:hypothetical protein
MATAAERMAKHRARAQYTRIELHLPRDLAGEVERTAGRWRLPRGEVLDLLLAAGMATIGPAASEPAARDRLRALSPRR